MESTKRRNVVSHVVSGDIIVFTVGSQSFQFDMAAADVAHGLTARTHGYVQKISDRAAMQRDADTGKPASPEEKFAAMQECAMRLQSGGAWNSETRGTGANSILFQAMRNLYPNSFTTKAAFAEFLDRKAEEQTAKLGKTVTAKQVSDFYAGRKNVLAEMDKIRKAASAEVGLDTQDMLSELE